MPVWQDNSESGRRLIDYLEPKVHSTLKQRRWKTIIIAGLYRRDDKNIASLSENRGRKFNWQRPTAEIIDEDTVKLNCFPTTNYVLHYASLVSTYFSSVDSEIAPTVEVIAPKRDAAADLFSHTNLADIGHADIVIIGYLDTFPPTWISSNEPMTKAGAHEKGRMFSWHKQKTRKGHTVAYLGCAAALWGDSVAYLVQAMQLICKLRCVLYVGRVGSLDPTLKPNQTLATGDLYHVDGTVLRRHNALSEWTSKSKLVQDGSLITVTSPLCEDQQWFQRWSKKHRWVDCETGYIARAAEQGNIDFGYLHIVSDNLGCQHAENLANEDEPTVQEERALLFREIDSILQLFIDNYDHETPQAYQASPAESKE
jgi:hypothetical protein